MSSKLGMARHWRRWRIGADALVAGKRDNQLPSIASRGRGCDFIREWHTIRPAEALFDDDRRCRGGDDLLPARGR